MLIHELKETIGGTIAMILMSNNQWKCDTNKPAWEEKGLDCSAEGRVGGLLRAYKEVMPDVLGLQEVSVHMADLFMAELEHVALPDGTVAKYEYVSGGDTPIHRLLNSKER